MLRHAVCILPQPPIADRANIMKKMFCSDETILDKNLLEALEDLRRRERERDFKRLSAVIAKVVEQSLVPGF